ncbi:MAG TPA: tetratricopeptide repeat protein [Chthoniobacterales bacterium]|jgi:TolB-like protein|nr:tetratricopeptide repeat protein [Chthoniobacterales bacterium]
MDSRNFFTELKRRNVYKVAIAYIVASWALSQGIAQVFPVFDVPNWAIRMIVLLIILGFPIALVFAWLFEITPQGIKRTEVADAMPAAAGQNRHAWIYIVVIAGAISVALFFLGRYTAGSKAVIRSPNDISNKSIAVLPFENLSDEKQNAYFAAGIQDEILTRLAKIGALKVISRSSTQQFQSKPGNLREIAQQLGVTNILEGSVQKAGDAVHVNAQLIHAATDDHLWAESYDCKLSEGIFAVEVEVAQKVASALNAKLTGAEEKVLAQKPTNNPAAYEAYLQGMAHYWQATEDDNKASLTSLEDAVRLDPQFAVAWAALARLHSRIFFSNNDMTPTRRAAAARALNEAVRLQPDIAETQLARAYFQYWVLRDYPGALGMLQQLRASWPNNSDAFHAMALISARLGRWTDALEDAERALALDPKDLYLRFQWIQIAMAMRDFPRAMAMIDSGLKIWPNESNLIGYQALILQAQGKLDEAESILKMASFNKNQTDTADVALFYQAWVRRDPLIALNSFDANAHGANAKDPAFLLVWGILQNQAGKSAEARANWTRALGILQKQYKEQPTNTAVIGPLAFGLAALGDREQTLKLLQEYDTNAAGDARSIGTGHEVRARSLVRLGDKEGAIASLEQLLSAPSDPIFGPPVTPALLRLDPDFDPLRGDPRFEKLCEEKSK